MYSLFLYVMTTACSTKDIQEKQLICKPKFIEEGKSFLSVWGMDESNDIYEINVLPLWQETKMLNC